MLGGAIVNGDSALSTILFNSFNVKIFPFCKSAVQELKLIRKGKKGSIT
jgi:hypothetical protein